MQQHPQILAINTKSRQTSSLSRLQKDLAQQPPVTRELVKNLRKFLLSRLRAQWTNSWRWELPFLILTIQRRGRAHRCDIAPSGRYCKWVYKRPQTFRLKDFPFMQRPKNRAKVS
jgi:hypothetical protein